MVAGTYRKTVLHVKALVPKLLPPRLTAVGDRGDIAKHLHHPSKLLSGELRYISALFRLKHSSTFAFRCLRRVRGPGLDCNPPPPW
jgi:hypothetical protein